MAESRVGDRPSSFWDAVGKDYYDDTMPVLAICQKHDLSVTEFTEARRQMGWTRRKARTISRQTLINRMFRLLDLSLKHLEDEMTATGSKEVMVLNHLANTLGKLIEIDGAAGKPKTPKQTKDMRDIRDKLVQRIAELKRG